MIGEGEKERDEGELFFFNGKREMGKRSGWLVWCQGGGCKGSKKWSGEGNWRQGRKEEEEDVRGPKISIAAVACEQRKGGAR